MGKLLLTNSDLLNSGKISRFIQKNGFFNFRRNQLVSLEILPKKTLSKNKLVLYRLALLGGGKKFKKDIWGKTTSSEQFELIRTLSRSPAGLHVPSHFAHLKQLKYSFSEGIEGSSFRSFEKSFPFLKKNIGKIALMLSVFQNTKIPQKILKNYSQAEEKELLKNSLDKIKNYSRATGQEFETIIQDYSNKVFSKCWHEKLFCFAHFDFQASNIFYSSGKSRFYLLDYDLAKRFNPVLDAANFWVHFYLMSRYHFSQTRTLNLCGKFLKYYLRGSKFKGEVEKCFNVFAGRAIIDVGKITASVFKKPCPESEKVFKKLREINELCN